MKCIDHDEAGGDEVSGSDDAPECVGQQDPAKPLALQMFIDRNAGQEDGRHFRRAAPADALGKLVTDEAVTRDGVVPHDVVTGHTPHKCSGDSPRLRPGCLLSQPRVELGFTGIE